MAKQIGPVKITGTIGNICFYEMDGEYYARLKSSLTGKRVKKDPRFRRTMEYAGMLVQASKIASRCYAGIPKEEREHAMYRALTGMAMQMLKAGIGPEEIAAAITPIETKITVPATAILPSEKIPLSRPRMLVDRNGQLIFSYPPFYLSCSKANAIRLKTGHPGRKYPLIINTISAGIPFVPN